jgi:sterol desaturase/sphingolipid hydroxylase (fatty acid hydroxylase superfamily)
VSPAHHQVHHSSNPKHFNKNFGSCLALWDWMFGTLYVPGKEREPLTFGFADQPDAHTMKGELVDPLINAAGHLKPLWQRRPANIAALPVAERKQA